MRLLVLILLLNALSVSAKQWGELHGNFEITAQVYNTDSVIGAPDVPERLGSNAFANFTYVLGDFSAGARFESYLNALQGFDPGYRGNGIPFRYAIYKADELEFTVGNFYEQFGSGLVFRSYEERQLGVDNAMEGVRVKFQPSRAVSLKGVVGKQRLFFGLGEGIVRGLDVDLNINELSDSLKRAKTRIVVGGSFVSKYQQDDTPTLVLPENVSAVAGRIRATRGKVSAYGEYAYKVNDPSQDNGFIYRHGQALFLTLSYARKGFSIAASSKTIDNMSFRSDRNEVVNNLNINYLPAISRQHTYNLAATLYPYATQPNGEAGLQLDVLYTIPRGSWLGGKYGTSIALNYAHVNALDQRTYPQISDPDSMRLGYEADFAKNVFSLGGRQRYFRDLNVEVSRKLNKRYRLKVLYVHLDYDIAVVQGLQGLPTVHADIGVVDVLYKVASRHAIRTELQLLQTNQHEKDWAAFVCEYTFSPHWFVGISDQYNYGNDVANQRIHYLTGSVGYTKGGNRLSMLYGRQRAGIFCVGGVCRNVPASNGLTVSVTSSF